MTTPTTVKVQLKLRQDTSSGWSAVNPILLAGELGRESNTGKIKIGDGSTAWNSLAYQPFGALITNADISATAEIAVSKLADGAARQLLQTDTAGTGVEWTSNVDVPGTLDVTGAATFDAAVTIAGNSTAASFIPTGSTVPTNGVYLSAANSVSIATNSTQRLLIDAAGQIEAVSLGSAAAPVYSFTTDPNSGLYSPGADQVAISTNGTGQVFINSNGNLGVGTLSATNTAGKIHARADGDEPKSLLVLQNRNAGGSAAVQLAFINGGVDYADDRYSYIRSIVTGAGQNGNNLTFATNPNGGAAQERLRITSDGKLGLGTSSPDSDLHLLKSSGGDVNVVLKVENSTTGQAQLHISAGSGTSNRAARVNFYNRVSSTSTPRWSIINDIDQNGTNGFSIVNAAGNAALNINQTGNVGIGTTSPGYAFDVAGQARIAGDFHLSGGSVVDGISQDLFLQGNTGYGVIFRTNGANERARIDSSGRLGLGTSSPAALFHAAGAGLFRGSVVGTAADLPTETTAFSVLHGTSYNTTPSCSINIGANNRDAVNNNEGFRWGITTPGDQGGLALAFSSTSWNGSANVTSERLRITDGGLVGIGTTSPRGLLSVSNNSTGGSFDSSIQIGYSVADYYGFRITNSNNPSSEYAGALKFERGTGATWSEAMRLDNSGRLLVGTSSDSGGALLQVNGNRVRVATAKTPASASDTGTTGEICWDANYVYVCTATNTWKRTAISTW